MTRAFLTNARLRLNALTGKTVMDSLADTKAREAWNQLFELLQDEAIYHQSLCLDGLADMAPLLRPWAWE